MNPKYLCEESHLSEGGAGAQPPPDTLADPHSTDTAPGRPLTHHSLSPPTYLLFFGWYPQKEMFFNWKKWLHLFPCRREMKGRVSSADRGHRWEIWRGAGGRGGHLGLLGIISLDADLHAPHADL